MGKNLNTWWGGAGTGDELKWLTSTGYTSPRKPAEPKRSNRRHTGKVIRWDSDRGYGWIEIDGGATVFVHVSELRRAGMDRLTYGERLTFEVGKGKNGKPAAINVMED